jgi:hypothetical protein
MSDWLLLDLDRFKRSSFERPSDEDRFLEH